MSNEIKTFAGLFSVDFWNDKIYIGKKSFPVGYFIVHLLNKYYDKDTALRLNILHYNLWPVMETFKLGYLYDHQIKPLKDMLLLIQDTLHSLEPFSFFKTKEEYKRIENLFCYENIKAATEYMIFKSNFSNNNVEYESHRLCGEDKVAIESGEKLLDEFSKTFEFYNYIAEDITVMQKQAIAFIEKLEDLPKRDESNLLVTALSTFKIVKTSTDFEYTAIQKSNKSKTLVTAKHMNFNRFLDFLIADFFEGIHNGHYPKRCKICGKYFLNTTARNHLYCDGHDPNDAKGRTCRRVAADKNRVSREERIKDSDPIKEIYQNLLSTIRIHKFRGKIKEETAKKARKRAQQLKFDAYQNYDAYFLSGQYKKDMVAQSIYNYLAGKR